MSVSSHRKLNVEQLINLAQVYWDDPTKLMEIADAAGGRVDQAAQLLSSAVTNRLSRLRGDPLKALGESPPDLAALIAARLGTKTLPAEEAAPNEEAAPDERAADQAHGQARRRRWPWAALLALALAGGGAWWFWPRGETAEAVAPAREIGIEIREGGLAAVEDEEKTGTVSGLPPGRRRPQPIDLPDIERLEEGLASEQSKVTEVPAPRVREPVIAAAKELDEPAEARGGAASPAGSGRAGGGGAAGSAAASAAAARAAARFADAGPGGGRASSGVAIEEALLQCYLTDSRPTACGPGGGSARPAAAGGGGGGAGGGGGGGATAPGAEAPAAGGGSGSTQTAAASRSRSEAASGGSGGSASAAGGGSPAGSASSEGGAQSTGERPSARASAGGGGDAASASKKVPPPRRTPVVVPTVPPDPDCPEEPAAGRVVFVFDGSISMGLPLGVDPAEEDRLDDGVRRRDPEARRAYRALLQQPGPKRMGRAQAAFADASVDLPATVELGLVVFQECRDIRQVGLFDAAARASAIDYIDRLVPRGRTPLAQSLASAAEMLGDGPSSIVILTDGIEFCRGDPCAVAEQVKTSRPGTPIHIIDVTGQARTACVADITGGRSYAPAETDDLTEVIRKAFRGAAPRCPEPRAAAAPPG